MLHKHILSHVLRWYETESDLPARETEAVNADDEAKRCSDEAKAKHELAQAMRRSVRHLPHGYIE